MKRGKMYNNSNNQVYSCKYHIVWCPKYRRNVLVDGVDKRLKELFLSWQEELDYIVVEMEVMPDHIHLLLDCTQDVNLPNLIKTLKGRSARILRKEFPWLNSRIPNLWTKSKFIATVGSVSLEVVKKYIEEQKNV